MFALHGSAARDVHSIATAEGRACRRRRGESVGGTIQRRSEEEMQRTVDLWLRHVEHTRGTIQWMRLRSRLPLVQAVGTDVSPHGCMAALQNLFTATLYKLRAPNWRADEAKPE